MRGEEVRRHEQEIEEILGEWVRRRAPELAETNVSRWMAKAAVAVLEAVDAER